MRSGYLVCAVLVGLMFCGTALADLSGDSKLISSAGMKFLANNQNEDGSYGKADDKVSTTAIVLYAMAVNGRSYRYNSGPFVSDAVDFLLGAQNGDGSFGAEAATFNAVAALKALEDERFAGAIAKAEEFLKNKNTVAADCAGLIVADQKALEFLGVPAAFTELSAASEAIARCKGVQEQINQQPQAFGRVHVKDGSGVLADDFVATALAVIVADRVERNKEFHKK